ncbi:hypothetical protein E2C01_091302 [Portunus trituberculatus]|uniref:Uncharacterized protein n=1 Tax=Portunus trituberculatus TaxID=210409 RepID=A0A5B7JN75_PORTR|nr:hypothetical protein [Portunus trituberculatus]
MSTSAFPPSRSFSPLHPPAPIQKNNPFGNVRYRFMPDCRCPRQVVPVLIGLVLSPPGCLYPRQAVYVLIRLSVLNQTVSVLTRLSLSSAGRLCPHHVILVLTRLYSLSTGRPCPSFCL